MWKGIGDKKEEICQEKMLQVRPEKAGARDLDGEWEGVPAWGSVGTVYALNAAAKLLMSAGSLVIL
jgi:hypothetical protein